MPHIHEKIDFIVDVYIIFKDKVLLRKHDKYNFWCVPGGHIELDEDPNIAAIREVKEEVGLDIILVGNKLGTNDPEEGFKDLIAPRYLNRHKISDTHEHISLTFFAKTNSDKINPHENEKSVECRWFSLEDLNNPSYGLKEHIKTYAIKALLELSNSNKLT